jgi:peptidoglycan hydrolase-like protein with peptidoglycan-binding domain
MSSIKRTPFKISNRTPNAHDVSVLQDALTKLGHEAPVSERKSAALGEGTKTALRDFQTRVGLNANGRPSGGTVAAIDRELAHVFFTKSKTRTSKLQDLLGQVGQPIAPADRDTRAFGTSTQSALKAFQKSAGLSEDGRVSDAVFARLEASALTKRLSSKTRASALQRKLIHVGRIAKLDLQISRDELASRTLGPTTKESVKKFQAKYGLPETGEIDPTTYERITSVAASRARPKKRLVLRQNETLTTVRRGLRLNKKGDSVGQLQRALSFLGFDIDQAENDVSTFGKTTRRAVVAFQKQKRLAPTGEVDATTKKAINAELLSLNPATVQPGTGTYRIRGTIRDKNWVGVGQARVEIWEAGPCGGIGKLAEGKTLDSGFFDVPYSPPNTPVNGQRKRAFRLEVRRVDAADQVVLASRTVFNPTPIFWVNFTEGDLPYRGPSEYAKRMAAVNNALGNATLLDIVQTGEQPGVTRLAESTGLTRDDVMRLILAHRAASVKLLASSTLDAPALYAFIQQNIPATLPGDLVAVAGDWTRIGDATAKTLQGIVLLEPNAQATALDMAVSRNLVPVETALSRTAILTALDAQRARFALETPTLGARGTLKELLSQSSIPVGRYMNVAQAYVDYGGMGPAFWANLRGYAVYFGGADKVADFWTAAQVGSLAAQHGPTLALLKRTLAEPAHPNLKKPSDFAKLDEAGWSRLLQEIGINEIPIETGERTPTEADRRKAYALQLAERAEHLFPAIALTEKVKARTPLPGLDKINEVQAFFETQLDEDFAQLEIDRLMRDVKTPGAEAEDVRQQAKAVQRVHRIAANASVGAILLEAGIHQSSQIMRLGRTRLVRLLKAKGVNKQIAKQTFARAEQRYAEMLSRFADFRGSLHLGDPKAIADHKYDKEALKEYVGELPNVEALFGSMDSFDSGESQSVYSPSAYLADLFRFLDSHETENRDKTVLAHLFERRPDLGALTLNGDNTSTPLPYIDLVCEILEAAVASHIDPVERILKPVAPPAAPAPTCSFQTTRTATELRAFPENVNAATYEALRRADFPITVAFDLWQEETRVWLNHLGVPRHELMTAYQARPNSGTQSPSDVSIAGESFGMSSLETTLVTKAEATTARQDIFWGLVTSQASVPVREFMARTGLEYTQLLELIEVAWTNAPDSPEKLAITPKGECKLDKLRLSNLTVARFDRIHRFLRLWRHSPWTMWELDLLIRAARLGDGEINANTLVNLQRFREVQSRLGLPLEVVLSFYAPLNREERPLPYNWGRKEFPLYARLFENSLVCSQSDAAFEGPTATESLSDHKRVLLAALAVNESDLQRLISRTNGLLTLDNLTWMHAEATFAQALQMRIEDWCTLLQLSGNSHETVEGTVWPIPFRTPENTLQFINMHTELVASGWTVAELDYALQYRPDSPHGLQLSEMTAVLEEIRESIRGAFEGDPLASPGDFQKPNPKLDASIKWEFRKRIKKTREGIVVDRIASFLSLAPDFARVLLKKLHNAVQESLLAVLSGKALAGTTKITHGNFPKAYAALRLLHKAALIIGKAGIRRVDDLKWVLIASTKIDSLDFSQLPVTVSTPPPLFAKWRTFARWARLMASLPEPEDTTWRGLFELTVSKVERSPATLLTTLHEGLSRLSGGQWTTNDVRAAHDALMIRHDANGTDYTGVETWERLIRAVTLAKRLGVDASRVGAWARRDEDLTGDQDSVATNEARFQAAKAVSEETRDAAKAKYADATWLATAAPLSDQLREKKRAALTCCLIEISRRAEGKSPYIMLDGKEWRNPKLWESADDLFRYFLIDVEMGASQTTSRIKQAISSTQTFIQRCFLNLEKPQVEVTLAERDDEGSPNSWRQWRWMKNYRLWEAARKVFFYPENWILPELRDQKSPIFKELEDELLQSDLTDAHAEAAFAHYLQKLHEVARVEVVSTYHEVDDVDPRDDAPPKERLHVIARTKSDPAVYYYRYLDYGNDEWSPWAKIEADVTGDHVQPVVYNRRLYLFWLVLLEKPQKVHRQPSTQSSTSENPQPPPEPAKQTEIQLAWSEYKDGAWTPKKLSRERLIHPWERPSHSYHLWPRYRCETNLLWLDVHISTSPEFNNATFYNVFTGRRRRLTRRYFDETRPPWHSSSFVFDGVTVAPMMRGLPGKCPQLDASGAPTEALTLTTSHAYVSGGFGEAARAIAKLEDDDISPRLQQPQGMHWHWNRLVNNRVPIKPKRLAVLEGQTSRVLLEGAKDPFELIGSPSNFGTGTANSGSRSFVYQDRERAFFIQTQPPSAHVCGKSILRHSEYLFRSFYHPYTGLLLRELNRSGVDGLLSRQLQLFPESYTPRNDFDFADTYGPLASSVKTDATADTYKPFASPVKDDATALRDIMDFDRCGAYSSYNWEVFFHAPFLIACKLSQNQRFEEAMRWFHRIFDPTNTEAVDTPQRFWITKPFYDQSSEDYRKQRIDLLLNPTDDAIAQIAAWRNDPLNPHRIARHRPIAYQKAVVMKYLDNLIAWGDQLFRLETIEAINEATLLYTLAHEILGPKPIQVPKIEGQFKSYDGLVQDGELDSLGGETAEIETLTPPGPKILISDPNADPLPYIDLYFSIPSNSQLLGYWSTVEDRLYKIRHCQNIDGVFRQLPLFEPPIDPALLVKARAAGVDTGSVLSDIDVAPGQYRFRVLLAKATEFCGEVRVLGDKLLSILEKRDAEGLATMRALYEVKLLEASREVRKMQVAEAAEALGALEQSRALAEEKRDYYRGRDFMNPWEIAAMALSGTSALAQSYIALGYVIAGGLRITPRFVTGCAGFSATPVVTADIVDGKKFGDTAEDAVRSLEAVAAGLDKLAAVASTVGSYQRRKDDWEFQASQAEIEIKQIDKQSAAGQIRQAIAEREKQNLELQIEQSQTAEAYLRTKFTNGELYDWMLGQVTTVYFQAYKLAFDMARRAEKCLQFELGRPDVSFIQFGYWDSLKKGLLSGERLANDLHRMEASYLALNERELELSKDISLAELNPLALLELKTNGECEFVLPEWLYDMDYPGHYRRRIRSVSITIPCVTGPYTGVHATLSLTGNGMRVSDRVPNSRDASDNNYSDPLGFDPKDDRFASNRVPVSTIATSHANNDAGLFELSFNDERYLPFEGAGAVSQWRLTMPKASNYFDFNTLADVVLHVRYTARAGGEALTLAATTNLNGLLPKSGVVLFDLVRAFGAEWHRSFSPTGDTAQVLTLRFGPEHLPFYARGKVARVQRVDLVLVSGHKEDFDVTFQAAGSSAVTSTAKTRKNKEDKEDQSAGVQDMTVEFPWQPPITPPNKPQVVLPPLFLGDWTFNIMKRGTEKLVRADLQAAFLVIQFSTEPAS